MEPIGNIPPTEAKGNNMLCWTIPPMAASLKPNSLRQTSGGSCLQRRMTYAPYQANTRHPYASFKPSRAPGQPYDTKRPANVIDHIGRAQCIHLIIINQN